MGRRIGIDVTSALAQGGGIGRYTRELAHALIAADPDSTYRLFSAKMSGPPPVPDSLPVAPNVAHCVAPAGEAWLYRLWYRLRLPLPVQWVTGDIDLFHSPDFVLPPVSGGIPTILTVHDLSFVFYPNAYPAQLVDYLNRVVPWSVGRATHVLADSQSTKDDLQRVWNVPGEKITVLLSGVSSRFLPVEDAAQLRSARARYGLDGAPYVLTVGTVQPRKNYPMLVRAFRPVAERHPHALAIAGGKGWLADELLAEIERQGLQDRVRLIGFVDDADLPALYSAATAFAFPSLYEGFGLPLLEAMACGAPVVTSNASSLPEVVGPAGGPGGGPTGGSGGGTNGAAALCLSPQDEAGWTAALLSLIEDPARRAQLIAAGHEQARRFSWDASARQLLAVYERLVASG